MRWTVEELRPLRGQLIVKPIFFQDSYKGPLELPSRIRQVYPSSGYVVARGRLLESIEVGDLIIYRPSQINPVEEEPYSSFYDQYFILNEAQVLAVVKEDVGARHQA